MFPLTDPIQMSAQALLEGSKLAQTCAASRSDESTERMGRHRVPTERGLQTLWSVNRIVIGVHQRAIRTISRTRTDSTRSAGWVDRRSVRATALRAAGALRALRTLRATGALRALRALGACRTLSAAGAVRALTVARTTTTVVEAVAGLGAVARPFAIADDRAVTCIAVTAVAVACIAVTAVAAAVSAVVSAVVAATAIVIVGGLAGQNVDQEIFDFERHQRSTGGERRASASTIRAWRREISSTV
jgi:hypothetical protein